MKAYLHIPFHDYRKWIKEGFRTRDAHTYNELKKKQQIVIVVNRPSSAFQNLIFSNKQVVGEKVLEKGNLSLIKVSANSYVIDFEVPIAINQLFKKHLWFVEKYNSEELYHFILDCSNHLNVKIDILLLQNVFAYQLALKFSDVSTLFDAWDNFLKFPVYKYIHSELETAYRKLSKAKNINWSTNSEINAEFYSTHFNLSSKPRVIRNGVNSDLRLGKFVLPEELEGLKKPIIGFGGKITHLMNCDLINYCTERNPDKTFVFVGAILDKKVSANILRRPNVLFLGDKPYDLYLNFASNFDIAFIPYRVDELQHGGDSIKAYEFLALNKKIVGTPGNGLERFSDYMYLSNTFEEVNLFLQNTNNEKKMIELDKYTWEKTVQKMIETAEHIG